MQKIYSVIVAGLICAVSALFSCTPQETPNPPDPGNDTTQVETPAIEIIRQDGMDKIEIPAQGGGFTLTYKIENGQEGGLVSAECPAEWIDSIDTSTEGSVFFNATANETENSREATFTIVYTYGENEQIKDSINIIQQAGEPAVEYDYEYDMAALTGAYYGPKGANGAHQYYTWLSDLPFDDDGYTQVGGTYYLFDIYASEPIDWSLYCMPEGTYTLGRYGQTEEGTFSIDNSYVLFQNADGHTDVYFSEGTLEVTVDDNLNYFFEAILTDTEGQTHHVTLTLYQPQWQDFSNHGGNYNILERDVELNPINAFSQYIIKYGDIMEASLNFTDMEMSGSNVTPPGYFLSVDAYMPLDKAGNIATGTYEISMDPGANLSLWYGEVYEIFGEITPMGTYVAYYDEEGVPYYGLAESGTMTVSGGNGYYEIDCNFTTFEGYTVTCKYSGELTVQNVPQGFSTLEGDYTLNLSNSVAKAQCWGDYYGTGGANWVLEISPADGTTGDGFSTDFVSYSTDNTFIESGSYVASEAECVNGIISGYTYPGQYLKGYYNQISNSTGGTMYYGDFDTYGNAASYAPAISGEMKITNHEDNSYTISLNMYDDFGNNWTGEWTGEISGATPYCVTAPSGKPLMTVPADEISKEEKAKIVYGNRVKVEKQKAAKVAMYKLCD